MEQRTNDSTNRSESGGNRHRRVSSVDPDSHDEAGENIARPGKSVEQPVPPVPTVDESNSDSASVAYSHYRTKLSNHRTGLSEHRTALSEYRSDLSTRRTEVSMRRTGMSFQRTRLGADRTLASVIRTSLALITFGFTVYKFFEQFEMNGQGNVMAARNFGISLVALGIVMLVLGIIYHSHFMLGMRKERKEMAAAGLIYAQSGFPPSMTLITAVILLMIGLAAIVSMTFQIGPFR